MILKKILLVDDDSSLNFIHKYILKDYAIDCQVDEALNGQEALDQIAASGDCPDIIFLDINMPILNGFDFLKEYESRGRCCEHSQVYMLTSSLREEDKVAALSYKSVKGYYDKPLTADHLTSIMASAI